MTSGFDVTICLLGICVCFLVLVFVSFFFVRFRSRLVRCRFALDLMDAAVAWLGTDIRGSSGVPQEVFYFSVLQVHPNQRKKSGTMAGGNKTKAKKHIFPAPSYSTTSKGRTKASVCLYPYNTVPVQQCSALDWVSVVGKKRSARSRR